MARKKSVKVMSNGGRRSLATLAPEVVAALSDGTRASRNLVEALAVDFAALLRAVCPRADAGAMERACADKMGIVQRMQLGGALVAAAGTREARRLARHPSDTVRGWACYALVAVPAELELAERIDRLRPFAADAHFGVREWAWMALRPHLAASLAEGIALLTPWTADPDPGIRRFATEATRPRGVWCAHLDALKLDPTPGLVLLEPLRADPAKYVQDSVANWLNDAAKSRPDFVRKLTTRWKRESPTPETQRICKRAMRSLTA